MSLTPINIPTTGAISLNYVPFSPTPNFTFQPGIPRIFAMLLTGNVTSSTIDTSTLAAGSKVVFMIQQDAVGNRTFNWPANFQGAQPILLGPNQTTMQEFTWTGKNFNACAAPQFF
jgi:hypothetical protein